MGTGAITQYVDVAQIVLYMFWLFFAGLIYYLLRENHREGYPMDTGRENGPKVEGWPPVPSPKTFKHHDGHETYSPDLNRPDGQTSAEPAHGWIGAPLEPVGNPLLAGIGPGAWAQRADVPDMTEHGEVKIVPLRVAQDHGVAKRDTDPWVDRMEMMFRYIEVALPQGGTRLLPVPFARIKKSGVEVHALLAHQFADVPTTRSPEQVTFLEEEKISACYGAGRLYATPERKEPLL